MYYWCGSMTLELTFLQGRWAKFFRRCYLPLSWSHPMHYAMYSCMCVCIHSSEWTTPYTRKHRHILTNYEYKYAHKRTNIHAKIKKPPPVLPILPSWSLCCPSPPLYAWMLTGGEGKVDSATRQPRMRQRIGSDSNLGLRVTGGLTFGPKPGAIDKG